MNPAHEEALFQLALAKPAEKRAAWLDVTPPQGSHECWPSRNAS